jgi:hypothetical protein
VSRARRVDAGQPRATERDLHVLRWVGEQYAAPMGVVRVLLERQGDRASAGERVARRFAGRMEALGWAQRASLLGRSWLVPSRAGLGFAGLEYGRWEPSGWLLGHVEAVCCVRLHLEALYPGCQWESERAIRERWAGTGARVRRADGGLQLPDGQVVGVEVELHVKRQERYSAAVADQDPAWTGGVWWFTPPRQAFLLRQRLGEAFASRHEVYELPVGVGL